MSGRRVDTSRIKSPRDPMTAEEREAVRAELREEMAWAAHYIAEHGDPWDGWRPDWARLDASELDPNPLSEDAA